MKSTAQDRHGPRGNFKHAFNGRNTDRAMLSKIAYRAMTERGLEPEFPLRALQELASIHKPAHEVEDVRDMRDRLWASIDNDDSRDLDQLTGCRVTGWRSCQDSRGSRRCGRIGSKEFRD